MNWKKTSSTQLSKWSAYLLDAWGYLRCTSSAKSPPSTIPCDLRISRRKRDSIILFHYALRSFFSKNCSLDLGWSFADVRYRPRVNCSERFSLSCRPLYPDSSYSRVFSLSFQSFAYDPALREAVIKLSLFSCSFLPRSGFVESPRNTISIYFYPFSFHVVSSPYKCRLSARSDRNLWTSV